MREINFYPERRVRGRNLARSRRGDRVSGGPEVCVERGMNAEMRKLYGILRARARSMGLKAYKSAAAKLAGFVLSSILSVSRMRRARILSVPRLNVDSLNPV